MPYDINALRNTLFSVLAGLKNGSCNIDQAKAINETAQTIINTAKVEVDFMKTSGKVIDSKFLPTLPDHAPGTQIGNKTITASGQQQTLPVAGGNVIAHRMR